MFYEWIEGRPLAPWSLAEIPVLQRQRVLDQLAEHLLDLFVGGADPDPRDIRFYGTWKLYSVTGTYLCSY